MYEQRNVKKEGEMRRISLLLGAVIAVGLVFVLGFWTGWRTNSAHLPAISQPAFAQSLGSSNAPITPYTFRQIAEKVSPCVVSITARKAVKVPEFDFPFWFFEQPFGFGWKKRLPKPRQRQFWRTAGGTGFIIDASGLILTNNHVVEDADEIDVKLLDDREFTAKVIGRDPETDVALVKIEAGEDLPVAALGDSDRLQVGDWVMAIGNPFGYDHSVTVGVVSAKDRRIGLGNYDRFIQTDAMINPGNSGGPLVNLQGEVIGINTAIAGLRTGIGFAVPINTARSILPQLKTGKVIRAWLGVMIQPITPDFQQSLGLPNRQGAIVSEVIPDSPAEKAGLESGDVIVEFDGKPVKSSRELPEMVAAEPVGKKVTVTVLRKGKRIEKRVKLGQRPGEVQVARQGKQRSRLGLRVQDLSDQIKGRYDLPEDMQGVIVTDVKFNSPAERAGIKEGDVILKIGWRSIRSAKEFYEICGELRSGVHLFLIYRDGNQFFVAVKVRK